MKGLETDNFLPSTPGTLFTYSGASPENSSSQPLVTATTPVRSQFVGAVLERLESIGVGTKVGSVTLCKAEFCRQPPDVGGGGGDGKGGVRGAIVDKDSAGKIVAARREWLAAASKLRIQQVKVQISQAAAFSFDFCSLLLIAGVLAGIGLVSENTVVIVASMLVSPIMGPVLGMTFGAVVRDGKLIKESMKTEFVALLLCVLMGVLLGLVCIFGGFFVDTWPTTEMSSRGDLSGLLTGIAIAVPSGMGVALSTLGNNTSSLVGVAISASLLPPAVNAGVCWIVALLLKIGAVEGFKGSEVGAGGGGKGWSTGALHTKT
jgi:uncharacterized hydrophobic protein (TIGR00271 family)